MAGSLAFFGGIGWQELLIILIIALIIFGRRLPEVGRSLGKGIVEFKKGLKGIEDDLEEVDRDIEASAGKKEPAQLEADAGYDEYAADMEQAEPAEQAPTSETGKTDHVS